MIVIHAVPEVPPLPNMTQRLSHRTPCVVTCTTGVAVAEQPAGRPQGPSQV